MGLTTNRKWWVFLALSLALMMVDLDITAVNLALVAIANDLKIDLSTAQWIIDGYMIAAAALMALGGRLSDIYGARRVFMGGLVLFTIASLAVGLSIGPMSVLITRVIQGACIAFTFPVALVIVRFVFNQKEQGFAIGLLIAIAGLSQALGPTVGGIIIHLIGWRWIFFLDVPLALFALIISYYTIPTSSLANNEKPLHAGSAVILVLGLLSLMTALNQVGLWGLSSFKFISLFVTGLVLIIIFAVIEFTTKKPLLELSLLVNKNFLLVNIVRIFSNFIYFTMLFTLSLLLQNILGYSTLKAGYILLGLTLTMGVLAIPAGKLIDHIGPKKPIVIGFLFLILSNVMLALIQENVSLPALLTALVVTGIAMALIVPATGIAALFSTPIEKSGSAMGVFLTNAFISAGIGIAISGWILMLQSSNKLHELLAHLQLSLTTNQQQTFEQAANGLIPLPAASNVFPPELLNHVSSLVNRAFISGFSQIMWLCVILGVLSFFFSLGINLPFHPVTNDSDEKLRSSAGQ